MDFHTHAAQYLNAFESDMKRDFHLIPNADFGGRRFPLFASYVHEDTSTLIMKNGKSVRSYEFCYFDVCECLNESVVGEYCAVLDNMAAQYVPWSEPSHGFSMLSMIVLTAGTPDRATQKVIKKYKHEETRKRPEDGYGWCSARLCVVDLSDGTCRVNTHGRALANRVKLTVSKVK